MTMSSLLTSAVNSGGMKTRWNACYACHNALKNECFTGTRDLKPCVVSTQRRWCSKICFIIIVIVFFFFIFFLIDGTNLNYCTIMTLKASIKIHYAMQN